MDNMYKLHLKLFKENLPIGESFDILERKAQIGFRKAEMFFVDGLTDGEKCQRFLAYFMSLEKVNIPIEEDLDSQGFIEKYLPFMDTTLISLEEKVAGYESMSLHERAYEDYKAALPKLYAGLVPLLVEGLDKIIIIDCRSYPNRSIDEPEKEKTLRGAKDGFVESMMDNISMIRRRIRDNNLIFKSYNIGNISKTDVAMAYMKERACPELVDRINACLKTLVEGKKDAPDELSVGDQSLLQDLLKALGVKGSLNPFPKVRYTQRPDVVSAHLNEGKIAIIVDNSPTVMLVPVSVFEFFQDVDDYYFPKLTGNYFRLIRMINFLVIMLLTPIYVLIVEYEKIAPEVLKFFIPEEAYAISIFWQFILLEMAVDGLKLASLNTPTSLGMSLSVIGALILGEFSVNSGWFIPQTILAMAVVALAAFTQPSIELSYAMKFFRILMLIGVQLLGALGLIAGATIGIVVMASTKTISGTSYLYPLVPLDLKKLNRLIFRQ